MAFRLGDAGFELLSYGARTGVDVGGEEGVERSAASMPAVPRGLMAALHRVEHGDVGRAAHGASGSDDSLPLSPSSRSAFERMYAQFRKTAEGEGGEEEEEDDDAKGGLSLAEVVGAAGMGFGRGLETIYARWGQPTVDPMQDALKEAERECGLRAQQRAEEKRKRAEENKRRAAERQVLEMGAGAWARAN